MVLIKVKLTNAFLVTSELRNDSCLAAADLAAYFESKYGNFGNTAKFDKNKRKRRERIEDLMDMGEGRCLFKSKILFVFHICFF